MNADQRLFAVATLVAGSLYLTGVFVAGLVTGDGQAWKLALLAQSACYLCYMAQASSPPVASWQDVLAVVAFFASVSIGAAAGLTLLF